MHIVCVTFGICIKSGNFQLEAFGMWCCGRVNWTGGHENEQKLVMHTGCMVYVLSCR